MCITTTKYGCGHEKSEEKECRWYRHEVISAQNERKKRGFLVNLFRRSSKVVCPLPPGIVELMHQVCPGCTEDRKQRNARLREHREVMSEDDFGIRRLEMKWGWMCDACFAEQRRVEHRHREANGGACCARGLDEFEAWEKRQGYLSVSSRHPSRIPLANHPSEAGRPRYSHKHDTSYLTAKLDAKKAAQDNGWDSEEDLEPHLVAQFVNMTGMGPGSLPPPPPPSKSAEPYYKDAGIDSERWEGARRTGHGSYPAPSQPPSDPLPVRPLRPAGRAASVSAAGTSLVGSAPRKPSQTPSAPTRPPRGSSTLATRSTPLRRAAPTLSPLQTASARPAASSGLTRSLRQPAAGRSTSARKSTTTSSHSTASKTYASRSGPSSTSKPLPSVPITSRHKHAALLEGRRVAPGSGSSRRLVRPTVTVDENGVSPPSSPASNSSPVSPESSHTLKGKKSVFHDLKRDIDDTMDCFADNEEGMRGRGRW
ncbi:hypothetical protein V8E51_014281 [Hyaloscypha variabilis]